MGKVHIYIDTSFDPITQMGRYAGVCYNSDTSIDEKNYKRGLECLETNHGRVLEIPQIYMFLGGYSAKVIREFYTHIGGMPTRLQSSTRYINYHNFNYITPLSIINNEEACKIYDCVMENIIAAYSKLKELGISNEDAAGILPLNMTTNVVVRTNLRNLIDMSHQRMCSRAYWEYRELMNDICDALSSYSAEWKEIVDKYFVPKCEYLGYCPESNSCERMPKKELTDK